MFRICFCAIVAVLFGCKTSTSDSDVKEDLLVVGPDAAMYVFRKSENEIMARQCKDLVVISDPKEIDTKCPLTLENQRVWGVQEFNNLVKGMYYKTFVKSELDWKVQEAPADAKSQKQNNAKKIEGIEAFLKAYPGAGGKYEKELGFLKSQNDQIQTQLGINESLSNFLNVVFPRLTNNQSGLFSISSGDANQQMLIGMLHEVFRLAKVDDSPIKLTGLKKIADLPSYDFISLIANVFYYSVGDEIVELDLNGKQKDRVDFSKTCAPERGNVDGLFYFSPVRAFATAKEGGVVEGPFFYCAYVYTFGKQGEKRAEKVFDRAGSVTDLNVFKDQHRMLKTSDILYDIVLGQGGVMTDKCLIEWTDYLNTTSKILSVCNGTGRKTLGHSAVSIGQITALNSPDILFRIPQYLRLPLVADVGEKTYDITPRALLDLEKANKAVTRSLMLNTEGSKLYVVLQFERNAKITHEIWAGDVIRR